MEETSKSILKHAVMTVTYLVMAAIAIASKRHAVHAAIAAVAFVYQVVWSFTFWGQQGQVVP